MSSGAGPYAGAPPVCPRHPDRVSYVRCQRCGEPTCPECQRPAAVGIQCASCVRQAASALPTGRTIFGGRVAQDARPLTTFALIGACVVVWIIQFVVPNATDDLAFVPALGWAEPWRFVTSMFAHVADPGSQMTYMHLPLNMLCLWMVGPYIEVALGRARYLAVYLLSGNGGAVCALLLATGPGPDGLVLPAGQSWLTGLIGASGAVFGLFGAVIVLNRHLGRSSSAMYGTLLLNAVLGFSISGVSWQAHFGGFVVGVLSALAVAGLRAPALRKYQWAALAGVFALLVVVSFVKYQMVPPEFRDLSVYLN